MPDEEQWHPARLIPTAGIRGQDEQERRATSSLLAVMGAVPEFGRAVLTDLDAPRGRISTFAEVQLKGANGKLSIPDGAIVVERGQKRWCCLVEVKTSGAPLKTEQVDRYLDMAREHGFDAVLTISNEITATPGDSPVSVDGRRTRAVKLYHLSWWRILTEAIVQHRHRGIADPDQAWILGELVAYLDHEKSGAAGFQDMGDKWVSARNAAANGTLRATDAEARDVATRWDQFIDYLCLGLSQDLGEEVKPVRPRKQASRARLDAATKNLAETGKLSGTIRVPDAVGPLTVEADLRTRTLSTSVTIEAPREKRPRTRVSWLTRQLKQAPGDLRLDASFVGARETSSLLLSEAREYPDRLLSAADPKRNPRAFDLTLTKPMGTKRGKGEKSFVLETRQQAVDFYRRIVQDLHAWQPSAPKLPDEPDDVPTTPEPQPPPLAPKSETRARPLIHQARLLAQSLRFIAASQRDPRRSFRAGCGGSLAGPCAGP
jgi:hypothetical protein